MLKQDTKYIHFKMKDSITKQEVAHIESVAAVTIYSADYSVKKGVKGLPKLIQGVIVSVNIQDEDLHFLKNDDYYLSRALNLIGVKRSEVKEYSVIDIKLIKIVKGL